MKLPRWLVIVLLSSSVLAVLAAAGWWWVTWPERTAREYASLMAAGRVDEAAKMTNGAHAKEPSIFAIQPGAGPWSPENLRFESRTWSDLILGRQRFKLWPIELDAAVFTAARGKVVGRSIEWVVDIDFDGRLEVVVPGGPRIMNLERKPVPTTAEEAKP